MKKITYKYKVSFFYIISPLSIHLFQSSTELVITLEKMYWLRARQGMRRIFFFFVVRRMNPPNRNVQRFEHVEITRHEFQAVRRMFQEFHFQISDGLKCLVSRMQTDIFVLQNCGWRHSSSSPCAVSRLHFVG